MPEYNSPFSDTLEQPVSSPPVLSKMSPAALRPLYEALNYSWLMQQRCKYEVSDELHSQLHLFNYCILCINPKTLSLPCAKRAQ